jgi:hypothetical protein
MIAIVVEILQHKIEKETYTKYYDPDATRPKEVRTKLGPYLTNKIT